VEENSKRILRNNFPFGVFFLLCTACVCVYSDKFHNFFSFEEAVELVKGRASRSDIRAKKEAFIRDLSVICINWKLLSEKTKL
jgi:hypothetical protein